MIYASNNKGKIRQTKELFKGKNLVGLKEYGIEIEVDETGSTFVENAILKAEAIYKMTGEAVLADDSGICIDALDGWPGVFTHRALGREATSREINTHILERLKGVKYEDRTATIVCVFALIDKNGKLTIFEGKSHGRIGFDFKGDNSFGFDEIFEYEEGKTYAMLTDEEKLARNARGDAYRQLEKALSEGLFIE